jgi:methylation protein EvaC
MSTLCRICGGEVERVLDLGQQPLSDLFLLPEADVSDGPPRGAAKQVFRLELGACGSCAMVQLMEEVPRDAMFGAHYPYRSGGSSVMRRHFEEMADRLLAGEWGSRPDPFIVEIGSNDGTMLKKVAAAGVRHLGVEPSSGIAETALAEGVEVLTAFFEEATARKIADEHGLANVIYSANTICHIPYLGSILDGVALLLADDGVFVFEDPYLGDIVDLVSFDQIYDEHFFLFSATTVDRAARRHGLELVDVERLAVHGGEVRYTLAKAGSREAAPAVGSLLEEERERKLHEPATLRAFAEKVAANAAELVTLLKQLRAEGKSVIGYGATAKSATVTNYCGIGPELVPVVVDTTPEKQGRLTPGVGIPVSPAARFRDPYPDYALLFAWNHATEIQEQEQEFRERGGKWIVYVPRVEIV